MDLQERVADELAKVVLELSETLNDPGIVDEVKKVVGTSSTTLEEAFLTAVRVRRAERRAYELLDRVRKENGLD